MSRPRRAAAWAAPRGADGEPEVGATAPRVLRSGRLQARCRSTDFYISATSRKQTRPTSKRRRPRDHAAAGPRAKTRPGTAFAARSRPTPSAVPWRLHSRCTSAVDSQPSGVGTRAWSPTGRGKPLLRHGVDTERTRVCHALYLAT